MATLTCARSDLFPPGTTVSVRPFGSNVGGGVPKGQELASGTVAAGGSLSITDSDIVSGKKYVLTAEVGGERRYVVARSTLDLHDGGTAIGTGDTTEDDATLATVTASSGAFQIGQTITGPGIPPGTTLVSGSGADWEMSAAATATASGVALKAYGAYAWRAKVRRRRAAIGTS
jgi:hypothetical protein